MMISIFFNNLDLPIAVSLPHFYNSDPSLLNEVEGLKPVKEKHESIVAMQPVSQCFINNPFKNNLLLYINFNLFIHRDSAYR